MNECIYCGGIVGESCHDPQGHQEDAFIRAHEIADKPPMRPCYQDDFCTIYCGDCIPVLYWIKQMSCVADITVSSPPYNQISQTNPSGMLKEHNHKQNAGYISHTDDLPESEYQSWMRDVFQNCAEISKGLVWINHKTRYRDRAGIHPLQIFPWPFYSEIVWDRSISITFNARKFAPSHEFIYGFGEPHYWDNSVNVKMTVWNHNPERDIKGHPCPFPIQIPLTLIKASCPPNGLVLDPFMGSGTTLLAAKQLRRRAIGIELEEKYCEIAARRLQQEYLPLVSNPAIKHEEPALL
jgi:site-specific DNA-methyltransferase (adenine-specific)